jgi:hypothetical protein
MNQSRIDEAVRDCILASLEQRDSMSVLQECLDDLRSRGWSSAELDIVKNTALGILYSTFGVEPLEVTAPA